jgi:3-deoxy-manno-octulosonate cytidylyltransferase (CMP-KDO synthetase)
VVVNVQGDEPFINPELINQVAHSLQNSTCAMATCGHVITNWEDLKNPHVVKIVLKENGQALYFSRASIPYPRDAYLNPNLAQEQNTTAPLGIRHIGLYAYRAQFLQQFQTLPQTHMERQEALEQLRALAHGFDIKVCMINTIPQPGIDTFEDLAKAQHYRGV